jgi:hypothetical protein
VIENHIHIEELTIKEPRLKSSEYEYNEDNLRNHIKDAFNRVCVELNKLNIDTRLLMIPIQLYDSNLTTKSFTSDWVKAQDNNRVRRLVVKVKEKFSTSFKVILEGSNDNGVTSDQSVALDVNSNYVSGTFDKEYSYYRFRVESEDELNINTLIYLVETTFDDLIIYKSLENFFTAKYRTVEDTFYSKRGVYKSKFETELEIINNNESGTSKSSFIRVGL